MAWPETISLHLTCNLLLKSFKQLRGCSLCPPDLVWGREQEKGRRDEQNQRDSVDREEVECILFIKVVIGERENYIYFHTWTPSGWQRHLCLEPTLGSAPAFLWKQTHTLNLRELASQHFPSHWDGLGRDDDIYSDRPPVPQKVCPKYQVLSVGSLIIPVLNESS